MDGTKSSSSNTTSLGTYQDIINNRWAEYDDTTRKYSVSNTPTVWDYLTEEYVSGRMSENDYVSLLAMYGVSEPTDAERAKARRIEYLNSLEQ